LDEIKREDIQKMHQDRKNAGAAAGSANRLLIMMRHIFNLALKWEVPGIKANPCHGVPLLEENNQLERYLRPRMPPRGRWMVTRHPPLLNLHLRLGGTMNEPSPVIAELPPHAEPSGPSRLALFLDGGTNNIDQDNLIEEGYFDNCYSYEDFLEDVQHRCALLDRVAARHPQADAALQGWRRVVEKNRFGNWAELKAAFNAIDRVGELVVFDIGGNKYRLIAYIRFARQILYIKAVLTHGEYDKGTWKP
jgi:mRNA interferase HigB